MLYSYVCVEEDSLKMERHRKRKTLVSVLTLLYLLININTDKRQPKLHK